MKPCHTPARCSKWHSTWGLEGSANTMRQQFVLAGLSLVSLLTSCVSTRSVRPASAPLRAEAPRPAPTPPDPAGVCRTDAQFVAGERCTFEDGASFHAGRGFCERATPAPAPVRA